MRGVRQGVFQGQLDPVGEGAAALPSLRRPRASRVLAPWQHCAHAPGDEVFSSARSRRAVVAGPAALRAAGHHGRAEEECLADAELRERRRASAAEKREVEEPAYVAAVTEAIRAAYPGCPPSEAERIAAWTCEKHSGRVGRSAAAKGFDPAALRLAVVAHIRHEHTRYDPLLMRSGDRALARAMVWPEIERILQRWETPAAG